jgi:hypothetical protein
MTPLNPGTNPNVALIRLQALITLLQPLFSSITLYDHIHLSVISHQLRWLVQTTMTKIDVIGL